MKQPHSSCLTSCLNVGAMTLVVSILGSLDIDNDAIAALSSGLGFCRPAQALPSWPVASLAGPLPSPPSVLLNVQGELELGDRVAYQDSSLYDEYQFEAEAGTPLHITLESQEFDPYLILIDPDGNILAQSDDISPNNQNCELILTLPMSGTYRVLANGFDRFSRGRYTLIVRITDAQPPGVPDDQSSRPEAEAPGWGRSALESLEHQFSSARHPVSALTRTLGWPFPA